VQKPEGSVTVISLPITRDGGWTARPHPTGKEDPSNAPHARPGMSPTSAELFLKQLVCCLLQAFRKPAERSSSLALPQFNSGILLGSSLALTPAAPARTSLKGKAGSEQSCGCRTQPGNRVSLPSPRSRREAHKRRSGSRLPGQRLWALARGWFPCPNSTPSDARAAAMGSADPGLLEARQQLRRGPSAGAALRGGIRCRLNPWP